MSTLADEAARRRTFAIISHPDAGKTTLTEKLLLFGGAIQLAGTVKGRKAARHATSDWMELEKQRGISVTSSVMQFPYQDAVVNLLDTPGHEDFSEDTYRTLTAVDSALMVIDVAKGVEARTIKLMEVCRLRATPIFTFINKLDREGRDAIELLDEVEDVLKIQCAPVTWPIGMGKRFRGVYHLEQDKVYLYASGDSSRRQEAKAINGLDNPLLDEVLEKNPDKLKIVFKHLPLQMHKQARPAAIAAIAAHEQGKFWQMHDALFAVSKKLNKETIQQAAKDIGLDMDKFNKDLTSSAVEEKLKKDMVDAGKAGVGGTPTLYINGRQVKGRGTDIIQNMIDQELSSQ